METQPSIFEKLIPVMEDYQLAELKIQQLRAKKISHILPGHVRELENAKTEAKEQFFEIIHNEPKP